MIRFMWQHTYLEFMVSFSLIWLIRNYYGISEIQKIFFHCIETIMHPLRATTIEFMKNMIQFFIYHYEYFCY